MPETLNTFFMGHPFKNIKSLQHVCNSLKIPTTGTAETLRNRIVKHVEDGKAQDEDVREIARIFKAKEQKKKDKEKTVMTNPPTSCVNQSLIDPCDHSTPVSQPLFSTQESNHNASSNSGESILNDESYEECDKTRKEGEDAQPPNATDILSSNEKKLSSNVKKLEHLVTKSVEVMASKDHQICILQDSVEVLQGSVTSLVETCGQISEKHENDLDSIKTELKSVKEEIMRNVQSINNKSESALGKVEGLGVLIESSVETIKQLLTEAQLLVNNLKNNNNNNNNNNASVSSNANNSSSSNINRSSSNVSGSSNANNSSSNNATSNAGSSSSSGCSDGSSSSGNSSDSNSGGSTGGSRDGSSSSGNASPPRIDMTNSATNAVNEVNDRLQRIAGFSTVTRKTQTVKKKTKRLVIADSNGDQLIPDLLHDDKNVVIEKRYTIERAVGDIPRCEAEVTDVVMMVGLNNIKQPNATIHDTVEKYDEMCKIYQSKFPKALIHIGSVAPVNEKCIRLNTELENLAQNRNASFVSSQSMLESTSFGTRPKPDVIKPNNIHYTPKGVKLIANEIKRSLYGHSTPRPTRFAQSNKTPSNYNGVWQNNQNLRNPAQANASNNVQELRQILSRAMSCLPCS